MAKVISIDPSGNWTEGKGTTGWALFEDGKLKDFGNVKAKDFDSAEQYWWNVLVASGPRGMYFGKHTIVCESFRLQPGKAAAQSWSAMETPMLIGCLKMEAWEHGHRFILQDPSCKARVPDNLLVQMGILEERNGRYYALGRPTNDHIRDAIRHGVYYHLYGVKRDE